MLLFFYVTQVRVIFEEGASVENIPPPNWPVGAFSQLKIDVRRPNSLRVMPLLGWWSWVQKESRLRKP